MRVGASCRVLRFGTPAAPESASIISPMSPPSVSILEATVTGSAARASLIDSAVALARNSRRPILRTGTCSLVFRIALQQFDRNPLRTANETDTDARSNVVRLGGELDTLAFQFGNDGVDLLHRKAEMIEALMRPHRSGADAIGERRNEYVRAAELHVDPAGGAHDVAAENLLEPARGRFRIRAAQMDMIPRDCRHIALLD